MGIVLSGVLILGVAIALPLLPGYGESGTVATIGVGYQLPQLQGLKDANTFVPADNPLTAEKVELGRLLFFDKRLSQNNTIACASCHLPEKGFTDGMPVSTGINNLKGGRSAPASINRAYSQAQFWDGRAETLEDQSIAPFVDPVEHGFINHDEMVAKMRQIPGYRKLFQDVFSREIVIEDVGRAIASFLRTILSGRPIASGKSWRRCILDRKKRCRASTPWASALAYRCTAPIALAATRCSTSSSLAVPPAITYSRSLKRIVTTGP